jgi:hypothetical protein
MSISGATADSDAIRSLVRRAMARRWPSALVASDETSRGDAHRGENFAAA